MNDELEFCPHCNGILRKQNLFKHPTFDDATHKILVTPKDDAIPEARHISRQKWEILVALRLAFNRVVSREYIHSRVFSRKFNDEPETLVYIDVNICRIRKVLIGSPFVILSVWRQGFRLTWKK